MSVATRGPMRWVGELGVHEPLVRLHVCETCAVCGELMVLVDVSVETRNRAIADRLLHEMQRGFRHLHECEEEIPLGEVADHPLALSKDQGLRPEDQREPPDPENDPKPCPDCGAPVAPGEPYAPYCSKDHRESHS